MPGPDWVRAVDANVLLRYLLADVPEQSERAKRLIESGEPLGLTALVLAEVGWTLAGQRSTLSRTEAARWVLRLMNLRSMRALGFDLDEMRLALLTCIDGGADLGDALIAGSARSAGIHEIYSFDQRFGRTGFESIEPPG